MVIINIHKEIMLTQPTLKFKGGISLCGEIIVQAFRFDHEKQLCLHQSVEVYLSSHDILLYNHDYNRILNFVNYIILIIIFY